MNDIRIIVAGSRGFIDYYLLAKSLDEYINGLGLYPKRLITIVSGTARGADRLGEIYALGRGYSVARFPADWATYGKSAGYLRNEEMAKYAAEETGVLFAFWDGESRGTKHMIDLANEHGLEVHVVRF